MKQLRYSYPIDGLLAGSSLGNPAAWATLDPLSDLRGLWNAGDNHYYAGEWTMSLEAEGALLEPGETVFTPEAQTTLFSGGELRAEKTFFLPFAAADASAAPPPFCKCAIMLVRLINGGTETATVRCRHRITFPAMANDLFTKQPLQEEMNQRVSVEEERETCIITTVGAPGQARVFGCGEPWKKIAADDRTLSLEYVLAVEGRGGVRDVGFVLAFSPEGKDGTREIYGQCREARSLLRQSQEAYADLLSRTEIVTPDPVINRGLQRAKVNCLRVQHRYRTGLAFTNDPPQDIVVIRDLAWYLFGSDYLTPGFSKALLEFGERFGYHEGGKLTEFLHADETTPVQHDYKLNINDDTPLFVEALFHHAATCLNVADLKRIFALMKRASDWILSQISDGLVRCTADGTSVWGICSWRNIIEGYNLTGAVTEINAECYRALLLTGKMARRIGETDEADRYHRAAEALRNAINSLLVSEKTRLYLLNLDKAGVAHHDVTGDLIFPVLFDVAEPARAAAIMKALTTPEMWTPWGAKTVHPMEGRYDPEFGYQLVGGVWPNLTAWISYCLRKSDPDRMVEGMVNIYSACEPESPNVMGRVVPGEFPERFHGEKRVSLGMSLSPWMPPTYLWLGVEGLLGVAPNLAGLEMNPSIPVSWGWIAVKNFLYRGETLDAFLIGGTLYSTLDLTTGYPLQVGTRVGSTSSNEAVVSIAIRMAGETVLFACSDEGGESTIEVQGLSAVIKRPVALEAGGASLIRLGAI